ncbi:3-methyl-2-oxobutanoate hydroxymethyltransferase [Streptomyces lincolnensis]|nr:3-methyl-2-oxobutanoate hydroxymethyltransferase [Streptomyces lincolnensis]
MRMSRLTRRFSLERMPSVFFGRIGRSRAWQRSRARIGRPASVYEGSAEQRFHTAVRFMKEAGAHAVKLEGGEEMVSQVELLTRSGIPVMARIGFTRSPNTALGYRVQRHGEDAQGLVSAGKALEAAGAFAVLIEMVLARFGAWLSWR